MQLRRRCRGWPVSGVSRNGGRMNYDTIQEMPVMIQGWIRTRCWFCPVEYPSVPDHHSGPSGYDVSISRKPSILEYIVYFPTKDHWKGPISTVEWIELGLVWTYGKHHHRRTKSESIAIPALGAGLGELPWEPVKELDSLPLWATSKAWISGCCSPDEYDRGSL